MKYLQKTKDFAQDNLIGLDETVLAALELFCSTDIKNPNFSDCKRPLIAGSGNAIVTAQIIFWDMDAIYCDETNFDECLQKDIDSVIIVSASWEKHAPIFAQKSIDKNIKTIVLTCTNNSSAEKIVWSNNTVVTPKNREPYTYNTSTYMWWIFAKTWENPQEIYDYILDVIDPITKKLDFSNFSSYLLVTPDEFAWVNQLFRVKFIELFGRKVARDVFSYEHLKHAITVVPDENELAISFGKWEFDFENTRVNIPLPETIWLAGIMAIWYYVIGKIQKSYPDYFWENISSYIERMNKSGFSQWLSVIVD